MAKKINHGKNFETWCKSYLEKKEHFVTRLRDVSLINGRRTKATQNPCDFITMYKGNAFFLECKACKQDRLPISRITQLELLQKAKESGAIPIIAINYYERKKKVVVELEAILNHDMRSIKYNDNICWDFKEYFEG